MSGAAARSASPSACPPPGRRLRLKLSFLFMLCCLCVAVFACAWLFVDDFCFVCSPPGRHLCRNQGAAIFVVSEPGRGHFYY